jgi:hypothetical protein
MESKTPQFDRLLDAILADLVPHVRTCHWADKHPHCQGDFSITTEDIEFLKMLRVPPPNFCPTCRRMRRLTHLNLTRLFSVTCDKESHDENLISVFPKECPFDIWDVDSFAEIDDYYLAQDFNNTLTPYHNLFKLRKNFPMPNFLNREGSVIDSPYSSGGRNLKNGYYVFGCFSSEDVWYTNHTKSARNVMDSRVIKKSEFVYQGFFSSYLYKSTFIYFSKSCSNSMFLYDCRNCTNCFGCVNLRNKSYCIWNVQYTKEEYEKWMQNHIPFTRAFIDETKSRFDIFVKQFPINASKKVQTNNSFGVLLENSNDLFNVTDATKSEHIRHSDGVISHKDSMDILFSGASSCLYMCTNIGSDAYNVKFSVSSKFCTESEFIFNCKNCSNCFMCFGLQNKSYCILNKQYDKDEYYREIDRIKTKLIECGEYADGVGMEFSAQAYNFSLAQLVQRLGRQNRRIILNNNVFLFSKIYGCDKI